MNIVNLFESYFWEVSTASVSLLVPIISIILIIKIIHFLIIRSLE